MLSAMARTTVGPPPRNRPATPSSFTILACRRAADARHAYVSEVGWEGGHAVPCCAIALTASSVGAATTSPSCWAAVGHKLGPRPLCCNQANLVLCCAVLTAGAAWCCSVSYTYTHGWLAGDRNDAAARAPRCLAAAWGSTAAAAAAAHHGVTHTLVVPALVHRQGAVCLQVHPNKARSTTNRYSTRAGHTVTVRRAQPHKSTWMDLMGGRL